MEMVEYGWYAYEDGLTVGGEGPSGGEVLWDEELGAIADPEYADARVTLERVPDGYAVTAHLYGGWLRTRRTYATRAEAEGAFDRWEEELERLAEALPEEGDPELAQKTATLQEEIRQATERV
jgi:hypothetical protein